MCFNKSNVDHLLEKIEEVLTEMEDGDLDLSPEKARLLMFGSANGPTPKIAPSSTQSLSSNGHEEPEPKRLRR